MTHRTSAPGKIILSGEYAVVFGYKGIAIPSSLTMDVSWHAGPDTISIDWPSANEHWIAYVKRIADECGEASGTLSIHTQLPLGKGMGSSTALVVAMARCFGLDRDRAFIIEDAVNPGHSGLDFEVIWENTTICFQKGKESYKLQATSYKLEHAVLVDTGTPDQSTPELVAWVRERSNDPGIADALATIGNCTDRLLAGEPPLAVFPDHHRAQVQLGVVSDKAQNLIKKIEQEGGAAKVIGAGGRTGGGGIVMALGDRDSIERIAQDTEMHMLPSF